jgi:uncharacterized membrane protein
MLHYTTRMTQRALLASLYLRAVVTWRSTFLACAFALYGLCAVAFLAINMPPFQNPDEVVHTLRAYQISEGGIVARRFTVGGQFEASGKVDPAIRQAAAGFSALRFHPNRKANRQDWMPKVFWTKERSLEPFPSSAIYPPQFYLPTAAAIWIGKISGLTVDHTLTLARLMVGATATIIGMIAIALADAAAPWIFALLTLPMSLSLMASDSQDGLLIASSALAIALYIQASRAPAAYRPKLLIALGLLLGMIFMARPPLAAASVLPLAIANTRWRWRVAAAAIPVVLVLAWSVLVAETSMVNFATPLGANPSRQIAYIVSHPLAIAHVFYRSLALEHQGLFAQFVGVLGWLDTTLPDWYYRMATWMLVAAVLACMFGAKGWRVGKFGYPLIALGLFGSIFGIFLIQYLSWTAPAAPIIAGVQGRYFLTVALTAAALLPAFGSRWTRIGDCLTAIVAVFPIVSLAVVMHVVILRYYLG